MSDPNPQIGPPPGLDYRVMHFVRHGEYHWAEHDQDICTLTDHGREQAHLAAAALKDVPIKAIFSSDLGRARETAEIIQQEAFPNVKLRRTRILRERILPGHPEFPLSDEQEADVRRDLQRAWKRFFKPARHECHELFVCHGNIIRGLVTMALEIPLERWFHMGTNHCGLTEFLVIARNNVAVMSYNERWHMPRDMWT